MWHARLAAPSSLCCKRRGRLGGGGANEVRLERVAMPGVAVGSGLTPHPNRTPLRTVVERSWGRASMEPRRGREEGRGRGRVELRGRGEQDMCGGTTTWWCESEKAEERVVREESRRDRLSASVEESAVGAHSGVSGSPSAGLDRGVDAPELAISLPRPGPAPCPPPCPPAPRGGPPGAVAPRPCAADSARSRRLTSAARRTRHLHMGEGENVSVGCMQAAGGGKGSRTWLSVVAVRVELGALGRSAAAVPSRAVVVRG